MADVDIDQFGEHDETDSHPDDTGENIPLPPVNPGEGSTLLEEVKFKKERSLILMLTVCTRSYLSIIAEPKMQPITITLDVKVCGFTSKAGTNHSPMRMES